MWWYSYPMISASKRLLARWFIEKAAVAPASLRRWNIALAVFFAVQGGAVLLFSVPYHVPVTLFYLTRDSLQSQLTGHLVTAMGSEQVVVLNLAYLVALFLFVAALAHLLAATVWRARYETALRKGVYALRWVEYAIASAAILVTLALSVGVHDLVTLLLIAGLAAVAPLCCWVMEAQYPLTGRKVAPRWLSAMIGANAGLLAWLALAVSLAATNIFGAGQAVPHFLYWTCPVALLLFAAFGGNLYLLYARRGRWAMYAYGERWYMLLSVLVKTYLAWQIFASVLHP